MAITADAPRLAEPDRSPRRITLPRLATIVAVAAVLYLAQDVFLPLSIAMLITFALSPLANGLRRRGLPMLWSVLLVVALAFSAIIAFTLTVMGQMAELAQNMPTFQANILTKLENLKAAGGGNGIAARLTEMITAINAEIGSALPTDSTAAAPMPVEVVEKTSVVQMLQDLVLPLLSPVATAGLVVVVVVFMLLEREQLRDRFIRLVGSNDIHRTNQVLEDAGSRVTNYLLVQLLVNMIYAVPIGVGLWLIGVPNAVLWGMLTLVLRFVPYIGSVLSAAFPLFLAFAVSPDWSAVLWTGALFMTVELLTSNVIEPWLYGSRTGVSPLAIIVAAIFWTFLWGPLGLVLSTPLTVCLVVLGRHIPQFELFDILFGDEPLLNPSDRLYQRLLAGDAVEATFRAEEALEEEDLVDYYQDTAIPALLQAQDDRDRGVLTRVQEERVASVALTMVNDLAAVAEEERVEERAEPAPGAGFRTLCIGGRWDIDDVSAAMLAQVMGVEGAEAEARPHGDLSPARLASLTGSGASCLILCFLDPNPSRASLLHIRRIKRAAPDLRVGVVIWQLPTDIEGEGEARKPLPMVTPQKLQEVEEIGADFVCTSFETAMDAAFVDATPRKLTVAAKPAAKALNRSKLRHSKPATKELSNG